jgi:hypothetical protein
MALPRTLCSLSNFFFLRELEGPKPLQRDLLKKQSQLTEFSTKKNSKTAAELTEREAQETKKRNKENNSSL